MRWRVRRRRPRDRRLLMIVHSEYPVGEARVRRQAEAAAASGWSVDVFALATEGAPRNEWVDGVHVFRSTMRRMRRLTPLGLVAEYGRFWIDAARFSARAATYRTIVVANPPDFLVFATITQRLRGATVILDVHDLMTDLFAVRLEKGMDSPEMRVLTVLERLSLLWADRLMTVHEPYRREILKRTGARRNASVVMNSADPRLFSRRSAPPDVPAVIGYHGSIFERYGVLAGCRRRPL